jgi:hypothetical protein
MPRLRAAIEAKDSPSTGSAGPVWHRCGGPQEPRSVVKDPLGLPGRQLAELLGERAGVAGLLEGFHGENGGGGVMPVGVTGRRREARDHHVRPKSANDAHDVGKDCVLVPDLERLAIVLGIAEVARAREVLLASIQPPRGKQLLGARHAERLPQLGAEDVLPPIAPRERKVGGPIAAAPRQIRDGVRVLVVGMRGDVEDATQRVESLQLVENDWPLGGLGGPAVRGAADQQARDDGG